MATPGTSVAAAAAPSPSTGPLKNLYHRRQVADSGARPCFICHKPSSTVLATPDARDFFYVCVGHLVDRGFASPVVSASAKPATAEARNGDSANADADEGVAMLRKEIDAVKAEYEAKVAKRSEAGADADADAEKKDKKERDEKVAALEKQLKAKAKAAPKMSDEDKKKKEDDDKKKAEESARVFTLHRGIFAMRTAKLAAAQTAKRNAERMRSPLAFPAVPTKTL